MSRCRSCDAEIIWAVTEPGGKAIPVDADPSEDGNVELLTRSSPTGYTVPPAAIVHGQRPMLTDGTFHKPHFATCPQASEWRKRLGPGFARGGPQ